MFFYLPRKRSKTHAHQHRKTQQQIHYGNDVGAGEEIIAVQDGPHADEVLAVPDADVLDVDIEEFEQQVLKTEFATIFKNVYKHLHAAADDSTEHLTTDVLTFSTCNKDEVDKPAVLLKVMSQGNRRNVICASVPFSR